MGQAFFREFEPEAIDIFPVEIKDIYLPFLTIILFVTGFDPEGILKNLEPHNIKKILRGRRLKLPGDVFVRIRFFFAFLAYFYRSIGATENSFHLFGGQIEFDYLILSTVNLKEKMIIRYHLKHRQLPPVRLLDIMLHLNIINFPHFFKIRRNLAELIRRFKRTFPIDIIRKSDHIHHAVNLAINKPEKEQGSRVIYLFFFDKLAIKVIFEDFGRNPGMDDQTISINKITIRILALAGALTSFESFKNNLSVFIELINIGKIEKDKGAVREEREFTGLAKDKVFAVIFNAHDFFQADDAAGFFVLRLF